MKIGLVMEGGAMRGMFTAGVIDVMMERGITFDGAVGVSAGAVFGCNYKSHQIGRVIRYNKRYCRDKRYVSLRSLIKTGNLYGVDFAYHLLPEKLDPFDTGTFENSPMEFYVVCTDADTGKPVYHKCEKGDAEDLEWMRASATMPLAGDIVNIDGQNLSDGGTADSIPIEFFRSIGYEKNVVILTQPLGYKKKKNKFLPIIRVALKKYKGLINALEERPIHYNETIKKIAELEREGNTFVIRPGEDLKIGAVEHNPNELERVYQLGRAAAKMRMDELLKFIS